VSDRIADIHGRTALVLAADGPPITAGGDVPDIIGRTWGTGAEFVVIPAERLADDFFTLASGLAGEVLQKFVNYRLRVVVVGDIARHTAASWRCGPSSASPTVAGTSGLWIPWTSWARGWPVDGRVRGRAGAERPAARGRSLSSTP
jgi:hypothetical protein